MILVQIARAIHRPDDHPVQTVAICAGSGGSLFRGIQADVFFTGELSHHEALAISESNSSAILCGHSNTERGYLKVIKQLLTKELEGVHVGPVSIEISQVDKDPLTIV